MAVRQKIREREVAAAVTVVHLEARIAVLEAMLARQDEMIAYWKRQTEIEQTSCITGQRSEMSSEIVKHEVAVGHEGRGHWYWQCLCGAGRGGLTKDSAVASQTDHINHTTPPESREQRLVAALRTVVEHHDQFIDGIIGPDLKAKYGDPPAIAEARRVLETLEKGE